MRPFEKHTLTLHFIEKTQNICSLIIKLCVIQKHIKFHDFFSCTLFTNDFWGCACNVFGEVFFSKACRIY